MVRSRRFLALPCALFLFGMAMPAGAEPVPSEPASKESEAAEGAPAESVSPETPPSDTTAEPASSEAPPSDTTAEPVANEADAKSATPIELVTTEGAGVVLNIHRFTLGNGLRVFVVEDHSVPVFSIYTAYGVGSRDEADGQSGYAHFFEHMMFKGSENVPDKGHFRYVLGAGGTMNATTDPDVTGYFNILPSHYLDMVLWLESDRMRSIDMTPEKFENQRAAVFEERSLNYDNVPYRAAFRDLENEIWAGSGYGHSTIGTPEDLENATVEDLQGFFDRFYQPTNAVIALVGDVDVNDVYAKIIANYGSIPAGKARPRLTDVDHTQVELNRTIEDPLAQQPLYYIGWKTAPEGHPDRDALDVLSAVLLNGKSSRIARRLIDDEQLAADVFDYGSVGDQAGMAGLAILPAPGAEWSAVLDAVLAEVEAVKAQGISNKELRKVINQATVGTVEHLSTNFERSFAIARGALLHDDPALILHQLERIQNVTAEDVQRVANTYLTEKKITFQVVPPAGGSEPDGSAQ